MKTLHVDYLRVSWNANCLQLLKKCKRNAIRDLSVNGGEGILFVINSQLATVNYYCALFTIYFAELVYKQLLVLFFDV